MKNILITGANGFVGSNLCNKLSLLDVNIYKFHRNTSLKKVEQYIKKIDFIYHFAAEVRPVSSKKEFFNSNVQTTKSLINLLLSNNLNIPILMTSSIHATNPTNDYGKSKLEAEKVLLDYNKKSNTSIYIYRLPHLFGEGAKPNHNSAITTWIYNTVMNLPITIYDRNIKIKYVYIQDFINEIVNIFYKKCNTSKIYYDIKPYYNVTLGEVYDLLQYFKKYNKLKSNNDFEVKLFKVYTYYKNRYQLY